MGTIWAIARHMISEGIRMKLALVFLLLIAAVVLGLPFSVAGDGSLTGAVQSFMTYGLSATGALLGLLTIFLSRSMADEMVSRQIFLLMSKPVPRWQYILGKWLGITVMNTIFLFTAGAVIYGMTFYIKATHPPIDERYDEAELNNEILVARHALKCKLPDFSKAAEREYQRNLEEGRYDDKPDFDAEAIKADLAARYQARWRLVAPRDRRVFEFENVLVDRSPDNVIQLRYKTQVSGYPPDEIYRAVWIFGDAAKGTRQVTVPVRHFVGRYHAVRAPADCVAADNTLRVLFINENPYQDEPIFNNVMEFRRADEVEVLFVVGSFEGNLFRLLSLMLCKLMFLAAVALLMTTVFSFPVACLASLTVLVFASTRQFLLESLDFTSDSFATLFTSVKEFLVQVVHYLVTVLYWVVPDFAHYNAIEDFVSGRNVSLVWVLDGVFWLVLVKTTIVLGLAMLLFHRREVAEVSV